MSEIDCTPVNTYEEFRRSLPHRGRIISILRRRLQHVGRIAAILNLWSQRTLLSNPGFICFIFYHHIFSDERGGFERQLEFMGRYGSFIGYDDAVSLIHSGTRIPGRYFCLSFDDGFKNCATNALPILAEREIPCTFFIPVNYIGSCLNKFPNHFGYSVPIEFMTWDDCRSLVRAGMLVGSHTCSHRRLSSLDQNEAEAELRESKTIIERELGQSCHHFCAPFGIPGLDFVPERESLLARGLGYQSFSTAQRGLMSGGNSTYSIVRNGLVAGWGEYQLKYLITM